VCVLKRANGNDRRAGIKNSSNIYFFFPRGIDQFFFNVQIYNARAYINRVLYKKKRTFWVLVTRKMARSLISITRHGASSVVL